MALTALKVATFRLAHCFSAEPKRPVSHGMLKFKVFSRWQIALRMLLKATWLFLTIVAARSVLKMRLGSSERNSCEEFHTSKGLYVENWTDSTSSSATCEADVHRMCKLADCLVSRLEPSRKYLKYELSIVSTLFVSAERTNTTDRHSRLVNLHNHFERQLIAIKSHCGLMHSIDRQFRTEFVLVDAPNEDTQPHLHEKLAQELNQIQRSCYFRILRVPRSFFLGLYNPDGMRYAEYIAKNIGIRRATSEWVLVLNAGILLNTNALRSVHHIAIHSRSRESKRYVYRLERFDLKASHLKLLLDEDLEFDYSKPPSLLTRPPNEFFDGFDESKMYPAHNLEFYQTAASGEGLLSCGAKEIPPEMLTCVPPWDPVYLKQLKSNKGLHEMRNCHLRDSLGWAAGDFLLGHRAFWQLSTAYPNFYGHAGIDTLILCRVPGACFTSVEISSQMNAGCAAIHLPHVRRDVHFESISDHHISGGEKGLFGSDWCRAEFCGLRGVSLRQIGNRLDWGFPNMDFHSRELRGRKFVSRQQGG